LTPHLRDSTMSTGSRCSHRQCHAKVSENQAAKDTAVTLPVAPPKNSVLPGGRNHGAPERLSRLLLGTLEGVGCPLRWYRRLQLLRRTENDATWQCRGICISRHLAGQAIPEASVGGKAWNRTCLPLQPMRVSGLAPGRGAARAHPPRAILSFAKPAKCLRPSHGHRHYGRRRRRAAL
jgi:hypothetical protein